ncbi:MAG: nickel pincer cofactor biosynthesis protein LarC [Oscillospiraceae bacterium]|nr:nickel pincer cofactor biosynthesis protein LarC [Oscillospiraceae bacterium]
MKTLYLDCSMGCAGDMLTGALLELFPNKEDILTQLNALGIPHVEYIAEKSVKCGVTGTHIRVLVTGEEEGDEHHHHHHHSGMADIAHIAEHLQISEAVRKQVLEIYQIIAQAESKVHGVPVDQIHFHEVGTMDAIADITAVCYLMDKLGAEKIYASPVHVGSGQVKCAHGLLPVPAPATAHILQGVPIYGGQIQGELCTPTGGALLKYYVNHFGEMPSMVTTAIGYGMGKKDFNAPNCVRAMLGETNGESDDILELSCNLDDMTGEEVGFALEQLMDAGALDAFTTPIGMKKSRPGIMLTALCRPADKEKLLSLIFRHTTTLGVRENRMRRYTLNRRMETVQTPYGPVRQKIAAGYGVARKKYEYEDLARLARERDLSLFDLPRQD